MKVKIRSWFQYFCSLFLHCSKLKTTFCRAILKGLLSENDVFGSNYLSFTGIYIFWAPLNSKIIFLAVGLSMCVCLCICLQHNSRTVCSRIFEFDNLYLYYTGKRLETFLWRYINLKRGGEWLKYVILTSPS